MKRVLILLALLLGLDRITKYLVVKFIPYGSGIDVFGEYVKIVHVRNPNSLWSISFGKNFPYVLIGVVAIVFLVVLMIEALRTKDFKSATIYTVIMAGVGGNILDRIYYKEVIDFIDVGISSTLRWPVFNVADSCISIGLLVYFIMVIREQFLKKRG